MIFPEKETVIFHIPENFLKKNHAAGFPAA